MYVSCDCYILSSTGLCVEPITRPEESYRVWYVWMSSWVLDNDEAWAQMGCRAMVKKDKFAIICHLIISCIYTRCPRRNVPDFGRVFLMLKYTDITQNTCVQSWTVTEVVAREKCGLLAGPRTVPVSWQSYLCPSLSLVSYDGKSEREVVRTINTRENILQMVPRSPCHV
jgi:hypothetical protein